MKKRFLIILLIVLVVSGCSAKQDVGENRQVTEGKPLETAVENDSVKKDSGTYVGLIDNHSIEIKISGVPEEKAAKAFELSDKIKDNFESFGLKTGDQVHFSYYVNNNGQMLITSIEKIQN